MTYDSIDSARRDGWHVRVTILLLGSRYTVKTYDMYHNLYGEGSFEYRTDQTTDSDAEKQALAWMDEQKKQYLNNQEST